MSLGEEPCGVQLALRSLGEGSCRVQLAFQSLGDGRCRVQLRSWGLRKADGDVLRASLMLGGAL
jgi:hypothetical protein